MLATGLTLLVVALHLLFALAESVGWTQMARRMGLRGEQVEATRALALNQGAYNAGVAVLLGWALFSGQAATVVALLLFIVAMAVVGAASVRWTIFVAQGVPAVLALAAHGLG
jgi:uncharacterized membrane protein